MKYMLRNLFIFVSACCMAIAVSCSNPQHAGGGADIGNPSATASISGIIVDKNNVPLANALVTLFTFDSTKIVGTAVTGADGSYRFDSIAAGDYTLLSMSSDSMLAGYQSDVVVKTDSADVAVSDTVDTAATIKGVLDSRLIQDSLSVIVYLMPTLNTLPSAAGEFVLKGIPAGTHLVAAVGKGKHRSVFALDTVEAIAGKEVLTDTLKPPVPGLGAKLVIVDDFEDGNKIPAGLLGGAWWAFEGPEKTHDISQIFNSQPGASQSTYAMKLTYNFDMSKAFPKVGVGCHMGFIRHYARNADLSQLEKVSFQARGTPNKLDVYFESIESPPPTTFLKIPALSESWQTYEFYIDTVLKTFTAQEQQDWHAVSYKAKSMAFMIQPHANADSTNGELYIDNIQFEFH